MEGRIEDFELVEIWALGYRSRTKGRANGATPICARTLLKPSVRRPYAGCDQALNHSTKKSLFWSRWDTQNQVSVISITRLLLESMT